MAKIQARNVDDALFARIEQSAMKNERSLEGEIRTALRAYYQPEGETEPAHSMRQEWQQETGQRLRWLLDRLIADGLLDKWTRDRSAGMVDFVRVAHQLGIRPGLLMDIAEGQREMPSRIADSLALHFGANSDWLLTGKGSSFSITRIGMTGYTEFFLPQNEGPYAFELIRISRGRHEGTLIILRTCAATGHTAFGVVTEAFYLRGGMGSGGYGTLEAFLIFLKTRCAHLAMNTYSFNPPEPDFDFWRVIGEHHPVWFQDANRRSTARWLQQIYSGEDPAGWFEGWEPLLRKIADTPFGGHVQAEADDAAAAGEGTQTV